MTLDQNIFISIRTLEKARNDDELAMIIAHELSHFLLSHSLLRSLQIYFTRKIWSRSSIDPSIGVKQKWFKNLVCQYREGALYSKYYERKADILSHELTHRAGFDILKGIEVYSGIFSLFKF